MINTLVLGILTFITSALVSDTDLRLIRDMSEKANVDESDGRFFADYMASYRNSDHPVLKGYAAASEIYLAQYGWNPYTKFDHFNKGKKDLESVISKFPENAELRFIRFAIQHEAPFFLNYSDRMNEDRIFLLNKFIHLIDQDLKKRIAAFMLEKVELDKEESKTYLSFHSSDVKTAVR